MNQIEFKRRTKQLGLAVIRMTEKFPETRLAWVVKDQILRSALSVGANYRAVCRAKSDKDFINKMRIVEEEADELKREVNELVAMVVASIRTKSIGLNKEQQSQNH